MDEKLFEDLIDSIEEAGRIMKGEANPSRVFDYPDRKPEAQKTSSADTKAPVPKRKVRRSARKSATEGA